MQSRRRDAPRTLRGVEGADEDNVGCNEKPHSALRAARPSFFPCGPPAAGLSRRGGKNCKHVAQSQRKRLFDRPAEGIGADAFAVPRNLAKPFGVLCNLAESRRVMRSRAGSYDVWRSLAESWCHGAAVHWGLGVAMSKMMRILAFDVVVVSW